MMQIYSYRAFLALIVLLCLAIVLGNGSHSANSVWNLDQAVRLLTFDPVPDIAAKGPYIHLQNCNSEHCVDVGLLPEHFLADKASQKFALFDWAVTAVFSTNHREIMVESPPQTQSCNNEHCVDVGMSLWSARVHY